MIGWAARIPHEYARIGADMQRFGHSAPRVPETKEDGLIALWLRAPGLASNSQGPDRGEPNALEAEARVLGNQVVVAVVVQDAHAGLVRAGSNHDVDRR
jgi:hypothetical protein